MHNNSDVFEVSWRHLRQHRYIQVIAQTILNLFKTQAIGVNVYATHMRKLRIVQKLWDILDTFKKLLAAQ